MPEYFALVDALAGKEREVGDALRRVEGLLGVEPCREGNYDYLVRFEASSFDVVDDFLQTHIRHVPFVKGVEVVLDWADHGAIARAARERLTTGQGQGQGQGRSSGEPRTAPLAPAPAHAPRRAILLLSGGLDSTVAAAMAREKGYELHALSFDYGQRHRRELHSARDVAKALGARSHTILAVPVGQLGGSALTDKAIGVPTGRTERQMGADIPATYVPARNIVFLSLALGLAEVKDADTIVIGANALDYSGYPDCRPEFFAAFQEAARLGTKRGVEGRPVTIDVPLQTMTKADIVREGLRLKAPLDLTWSCYQGDDKACGKCDSCVLRLKGFREAGASDPIAYG